MFRVTQSILLFPWLLGIGAAIGCNSNDFRQNPKGVKGIRPECNPLESGHDQFWFTVTTTEDHYKALSEMVLKNTASGGRYYQAVFPDSVRSRINVADSDVNACRTIQCCKFLSDVLPQISSGALDKISPLCVSIITHDARTGDSGREMSHIDYLPESVINKYGRIIVQQMNGSPTPIMQNIPIELFKKILTTRAACKAIRREQWKGIISSPTHAQVISDECAHAGQQELSKTIDEAAKTSNFDSKVFAHFNRKLDATLLRTASIEQIGNFASNVEEGQFPGKQLNASQLKSNAKGLTLRLIRGIIFGSTGASLRGMDKMIWAQVSGDIFDQVSVDDAATFADAINDEHFQSGLKTTQITALAKHSAICEKLHPVIAGRKVPISKGCFMSMRPSTQAALIGSSSPLEDDLLSNVTAADIKKWDYNNFKGLEVLNNGGKHPNLAAIVANLGSQVNYGHPFSLVDKVETLQKLPVLQMYMTVAQFNELGFTLEAKQYALLKPRLAFLREYADLKENQKPDFWTEMTPEVLAMLISNGDFCGKVEKEILLLIKRDALSTMTLGCLAQIKYLDETPTDFIEAIPPAVFKTATTKVVTAKVLSMMSAQQIAVVGSEAGEADSVVVHFTPELIDGFDDERLKSVQAVHWGGIVPQAFETFKKPERLALIAGPSMAHWNKDQVEKIPKTSLAKLTPDQATNIGASVDVEKSPLHVLTNDIGFSPEVRTILEKRRSEANIQFAAEGGWSTTLVIVGVVVALSAVGAGIYYWKSNQE